MFRLGTYTGNVPNYSNMRACKGTMFFLPVPLKKTQKTIQEVEKKPGEAMAGLPDPALYIIFNGKPSKNTILWQSIVNVDHIKAAVQKFKEINWLYDDVDDCSTDAASQRVIECVNDARSTMLVRATAEYVISLQAYTDALTRSSQPWLTLNITSS